MTIQNMLSNTNSGNNLSPEMITNLICALMNETLQHR